MTTTDWLLVLIVVVLFLFSIVLALSEMAFSRMNRIRALALEEEEKRGAAKLARMLERPEQTINSLLLLVLIAQVVEHAKFGPLILGSSLGTSPGSRHPGAVQRQLSLFRDAVSDCALEFRA